jgi:regulatory protein YycI of two-component signal transduction system YycFG
MKLIVKLPLFMLLLSLLGSCTPKDRYDIDNDKIISDLNSQIKTLEEDLNTLNNELDQVKVVLNDKDIDADLRASIRKEIHEGDKYVKEIDQWLSYFKVQRKQRYKSLYLRKDSSDLIKEAEVEAEAFFINKKLKPLVPTWKERYRTAIEL